jgi:hypothetical protein
VELLNRLNEVKRNILIVSIIGDEEILKDKTDKEIATYLNRTYWSVVYKVKDLRKNGLL